MITDKRIIYPSDTGGVVVLIPSPNWKGTIEELANKDVPQGKHFLVIDKKDVPEDRTFRDAWEYPVQ
jgi:hypothetical protein